MKTKLGSFLTLTALLTFGSCASKGPIVRHSTPFPAKIAVLPMNNLSVDMQGPVLVRNLMETHLSASGYEVIDSQMTDEKLKTIGINEGGQLAATTAQKLGLLLGADAVLYGELQEFKSMNLGVYANRVVEAKFRLVDTKDGQSLWEVTKKKSNKKVGLNKEAIKDNLVSGYSGKLLENILGNPLRPEAEEVARLTVKDLNKTRKNW